jgi:hypothetical protein
MGAPNFRDDDMPTEVYKDIGVISAKAEAAHSRLDRLENEIKETLKGIQVDLKELSAHMNKTKGFSAAWLFLASIAGAGLTKLAAMIFSSH